MAGTPSSESESVGEPDVELELTGGRTEVPLACSLGGGVPRVRIARKKRNIENDFYSIKEFIHSSIEFELVGRRPWMLLALGFPPGSVCREKMSEEKAMKSK